MNQLVQYTTRSVSLILAVFATLTLAACGGGGGGGGGGTPDEGGGAPVAGIFTKTPNLTTTGNSNGIFGNTSMKEQNLYLASEINGSGYINKISFQLLFDNLSAMDCANTTVKLGHTSLGTLAAAFSDNVETGQGSQVTVINDATVTIPVASANDYFDIVLDTPFHYNGVDNLVVEITRTSACASSIPILVDSSPATTRLRYASPIAATGVAGTFLPLTKFHFAGGDNNMGYAASGSGSAPFITTVDWNHAQMLHKAGSIDGSGLITGIALISNIDSTAQTYTVNIKLGHTTLSELTDTYTNNFDGASPVTIATGLTFTIPDGVPAGIPIWLPVTGSFDYNGTDNLIVDVEVMTASGTTAWANDGVFANQRLYGAVGDAVGNLAGGSPHTVFRFDGGTMDVITSAPDGSGDSFPFYLNDGVRQYLFLAAELGTAGQITQVGCRNWSSDVVAQTGLNYTITMSHTATTALVSDRATNLPTPVVVYSGTFDQPALLGGDWFDIQLSTPFTYNGTDNLVVEVSGTGGTDFAGVGCRLDSASTTLYASRRTGGTSGATSLFTSDALIDMRFTLQ